MNGKNQQIRGKIRELQGKATFNMGQVIKGKYQQRGRKGSRKMAKG